MATGRKQQEPHHDAGRIIKLNTGIHKMGLPGDNAAVLRQSLESRSELHLLHACGIEPITNYGLGEMN